MGLADDAIAQRRDNVANLLESLVTDMCAEEERHLADLLKATEAMAVKREKIAKVSKKG